MKKALHAGLLFMTHTLRCEWEILPVDIASD